MMKLIQCCEKQGIFIFIGLIVLLFPFVNTYYLAAAFVGAALLFSVLSPGSPAFGFFARESDVKAGKLISLIQLFFTIAFLFIINLAVGQNKFPLFIIGAAFAITTFGDGVADAVNILEKAKETGQTHEIKYYSAKSSIVFLISGSLYAFVAGTWISGFTLKVPDGMLFFLAVIGAITGALLESMITNDDNIVIPFGSAMVMWLFYMFGYNVDTVYLMQVLVFSFVLGYLAYKARIADISAMLSATLLGVVIILSSNKGWFLFSILLAFFLLGSLFTCYKYGYKLARGIAEGKGGARGYKNVFSNSLAALALAVAYGIFPAHGQILLAGYLGSVATACGDTLASEIGETYKGEPRMITTFKKARPGTDGAISHLGEAAAFFGAFAIAVLAFFFIKKDITLMIAAAAGGFIGTNIDSVLGATLQQKGYLSNNGVNLFATISGAIIAGILYSSMGL
ncbi:MAG: TIGR00297 family protein [Candidatus Methanoperedens sp.]|nr:TIGR00297 family protein [Candidatus Methanoperedens sp.]